MKHLLQRLITHILEKSSHDKIISNLLCEFLELHNSDVSNLRLHWHPLGFLKSNLGQIEGVGNLRMHVWYPNFRQAQEPVMLVHNHDWMLNSHIVYGALTNELYEIVPCSSIQASNTVYYVEYNQNFSILKTTDEKVLCKLTSNERFQAGQQYDVPIGQYHSTFVPEKDFTVTIVASTQQQESSAKVLGPIHGEKVYTYNRITCEPEIAATVIQHVIRHLKQ